MTHSCDSASPSWPSGLWTTDCSVVAPFPVSRWCRFALPQPGYLMIRHELQLRVWCACHSYVGREGRIICERRSWTAVEIDVDLSPSTTGRPGPQCLRVLRQRDAGPLPFAFCPFARRPLHPRPPTPTTVRRDRACEPSLRTESRRVGGHCDGGTRARQRAHWMKALDVIRHPDCGEQLASTEPRRLSLGLTSD